MNPFSEKLKSLRGNRSVEELAHRSGVAASSIYKMESTAKVRWQTVEKAYGGLFANRREHLVTLILWALEQGETKLDLRDTAEAVSDILGQESAQMKEQQEKLNPIAKSLSPVDASLLLDFAQKFASSDSTRQMAQAWLEALAGK